MKSGFISLSIKSIIRDWRSGELTLLALAMIIAVACVSSMTILSHTINLEIFAKASQVLGAEVLVKSPEAIDSKWQQQAKKIGVRQTMTLSFFSMVQANDEFNLAQVKAVKANYPLLGELIISDSLFGKNRKAPAVVAPGEVWLSSRLLALLNVSIGQTVTIGESKLKVTAVLIEEPGQAGDWFNIAPRLMMNWQDVAKTQVIQPGSRLVYQWLLSAKSQPLNQLQQWVKPKLNEQQRLIDSRNSSPTITKAISRTLDFLNLGTLMSLILACVAVSMASIRYSQRHTKQVALLRCFGASQRQIFILYLSSLLILGALACFIGVVLGYLAQPLLMQWLQGLVDIRHYQIILWPGLLSFTTGMLVLLFFCLMHIISLAKINASYLLRSVNLYQQSNSVSYALAFCLLAFLSYLYTKSVAITQAVLLGCLAFIALVYAAIYLLSRVMLKRKRMLRLNWRFGILNISRNRTNSALQVIGIGLAVTTMVTLSFLQWSLTADWKKQLPKNAPNYFIININPEQVDSITAEIKRYQVDASKIYPMVRGRLIEINKHTPLTLLGEEKVKTIRPLQRELNLSWSSIIPDENEIIQGLWLNESSPSHWVSVEQGLAKNLELKLGDQLSFRIADKVVKAKVTSFRKVNWTNFKPNFFMLFKPGLLNDLPKTFITSFYLSSQNKQLLNTLIKQFPNITIIDVASMLNKVQTMINTSSKVINYLMIFALGVGFVILMLAMLVFSGAKLKEVQLLKSLGMSKKQLLLIQSSEGLIIGFIAGVIAVIIATAINYYLVATVLKIGFTIYWLWLILIPLLLSLLTGLLSIIVLSSQYET